MQINSNFYILPQLNGSFHDHLALTLSVFGAQVCMLFSTTYHTFGCCNAKLRNKWLRADVFGISAGLIGMYLSGIYTSFYCFQEILRTYLITLLLILATSIYIPTRDDFFQSKIWGNRIGYLHLSYIGLIAFGLYPTAHWISLHGGFENPHVMNWFPTIVILFALIGLAFLFYATLIPERFFPGYFDLVGSSHHLWHMLILSAMIYWHRSGINMLTFYHSNPQFCIYVQEPQNGRFNISNSSSIL
uniref:Progestin and adipoQ receptor family member 3 n=1 Tax=Acrobeloides nanus TaxID=290746 RepID=A0A914C836_9BILA